jgi:hypothetical protein
VTDSPAVSVVIPLYNKRATVARTLESVFAQTFSDFEVVVVDDGSADGGAEFIAQAFPDPRIRIHRQANAGPGAARNRGAEVSRAPLIIFLDADDTWRPDLLSWATERMAQHPECAAFTAAFILEPAGIDRWAELRAHGLTEGVWRLTPDISREALATCLGVFHACSAVFRSEAVAAYGGFYEKDRCTLGEDIYFWIQVLLNAPIYCCVEPLAEYHMEDSELGVGGRKGALPLEPLLTEPDPVRAICPPELRETLEAWLAQHALRNAFIQIDRGDPDKARWLVGRFPRMRELGGRYLKLRARLAVPGLWTLARALRGR